MVGFYHLFVLFLISNKISFSPEVKRIHETTLCVLFGPKTNKFVTKIWILIPIHSC